MAERSSAACLRWASGGLAVVRSAARLGGWRARVHVLAGLLVTAPEISHVAANSPTAGGGVHSPFFSGSRTVVYNSWWLSIRPPGYRRKYGVIHRMKARFVCTPPPVLSSRLFFIDFPPDLPTGPVAVCVAASWARSERIMYYLRKGSRCAFTCNRWWYRRSLISVLGARVCEPARLCASGSRGTLLD